MNYDRTHPLPKFDELLNVELFCTGSGWTLKCKTRLKGVEGRLDLGPFPSLDEAAKAAHDRLGASLTLDVTHHTSAKQSGMSA
jgi:hypothetical protein